MLRGLLLPMAQMLSSIDDFRTGDGLGGDVGDGAFVDGRHKGFAGGRRRHFDALVDTRQRRLVDDVVVYRRGRARDMQMLAATVVTHAILVVQMAFSVQPFSLRPRRGCARRFPLGDGTLSHARWFAR